ncbi:ABC transporter ATP-binding protein [Thermoanaerobacter kivui]|nr:ABC transporter ATP-binding protein [Thermoanaerobacter kivui]
MFVEVKNLYKSYNNSMVLKDINIRIDKPGVYLIAGPNGSGKTTLLEIIIGLRKADKGSVIINGKFGNDIETKEKVGFLTQENSLRKSSKVKEELNLVKDIFNLNIDTYEYLCKFGLQKYYNKRTKQLSGGTKRRLLVTMLFMAGQDIVILDEPVSGLDPFNRNEIWNMIKDYSRNKIVIVSDHYLNEAARYSDYIYLINEGRIILSGTTTDIMSLCKDRYLIKVRKEFFDEVENFISAHFNDYEVRISGTVYHIFLKGDKNRLIRMLEEKGMSFAIHDVDFEDIYFYYTGTIVNQEGVVK